MPSPTGPRWQVRLVRRTTLGLAACAAVTMSGLLLLSLCLPRTPSAVGRVSTTRAVLPNCHPPGPAHCAGPTWFWLEVARGDGSRFTVQVFRTAFTKCPLHQPYPACAHNER